MQAILIYLVLFVWFPMLLFGVLYKIVDYFKCCECDDTYDDLRDSISLTMCGYSEL